MKLIKSIEKLVEDAEREYNSIMESTSDIKEIDRAEKNYLDTLMSNYYMLNEID